MVLHSVPAPKSLTYLQAMKSRLTLVILILGVISCQKETSDTLNPNILEGSWLLIETLHWRDPCFLAAEDCPHKVLYTVAEP